MPRMTRRGVLSLMAGALGGLLAFAPAESDGGQRRARRARRRVRRRVRRRIRRRVTFRTVAGRRVWIAPAALAVGWELVLDHDRVVVVTQLKTVDRAGATVELAVVRGPDGKTEEIEIVHEDTAENKKDLQGSVLPDGDTSTPAIEGDEDVEVDE